MSAAPSSSRRSRCASSACASSTRRTAPSSNGKRIVLVDDSLVRGTTSVKIVRMMREAGAREVHFRIASPPITHPDFYGIDTPERDKLLAATHDLEGMRRYIGADTLAFLSVDGIYRAMGYERRDPARPQFTDHCFTGDYPTPLTDLAVATPRRLAMLAEADEPRRCHSGAARTGTHNRQRCRTRTTVSHHREDLHLWVPGSRSARPGMTAGGRFPRNRLGLRPMDKPLADRLAVVTGASRGIGRAAALAFAARRRACDRARAHARRARGARRRGPRRRSVGDPRAARPQGLRRPRPPRRHDPRALGQARHPARQRRPSRRDRAADPCRPAGLGCGHGGQRHGELAPHPLARPAAAQDPTPAARSS